MILAPVTLFVSVVYLIAGPGFSPAHAQDNADVGRQSVRRTDTVPWAKYVHAVTRLYALQGGAPLWLRHLGLSHAGQAAIQELLRAEVHGLDPAHDQASTLDSLARRALRQSLSRAHLDRLDALLSVSLICFLDDLQFGRLHPRALDRTGTDTGIQLRSRHP